MPNVLNMGNAASQNIIYYFFIMVAIYRFMCVFVFACLFVSPLLLQFRIYLHGDISL